MLGSPALFTRADQRCRCTVPSALKPTYTYSFKFGIMCRKNPPPVLLKRMCVRSSTLSVTRCASVFVEELGGRSLPYTLTFVALAFAGSTLFNFTELRLRLCF